MGKVIALKTNHVSLIAKIDDRLFRHLRADRTQDGKSANAGVEDTNGRSFSHHGLVKVGIGKTPSDGWQVNLKFGFGESGTGISLISP